MAAEEYASNVTPFTRVEEWKKIVKIQIEISVQKKLNDNKHNNKQKQNKHKKTKMQVQRNGNSKKIANVPRLVCTSTFGMSATEAASIEFGKVQCCSL